MPAKRSRWRGLLRALPATLLVYVLLALLFVLPARFNFLDPIGDALADFDPSDIVYSRLRDPEPVADTNVVLVNIGTLPRQGIAAQISALASFQPAVIGVDVLFFNPHPEPEADSALARALRSGVPVVFASQLLKPSQKTGRFDSLALPVAPFDKLADNGFANLIGGSREEPMTVRDMAIRQSLKDSTVLPFALRIARYKYGAQVDSLLAQRRELTMPISYRRQARHYARLTLQDFMQGHLPVNLKDKVVLLGYMGPNDLTTDLEDKFFTPLNPRYAGKAMPDLYGVVVHANIISMVGAQDYINQMPEKMAHALGFLLIWFNMWVFLGLKQRSEVYYDLWSKLLQGIQVFGLLMGMVLVYYAWGWHINITLTTAVLLISGDFLEVYLNLEKMAVTSWNKLVLTSRQVTHKSHA